MLVFMPGVRFDQFLFLYYFLFFAVVISHSYNLWYFEIRYSDIFGFGFFFCYNCKIFFIFQPDGEKHIA